MQSLKVASCEGGLYGRSSERNEIGKFADAACKTSDTAVCDCMQDNG